MLTCDVSALCNIVACLNIYSWPLIRFVRGNATPHINTRLNVLFECAVLLYAACTCMQHPRYTDIHLQVPIYKVQVFANYKISIKIPKELLVQGYSLR